MPKRRAVYRWQVEWLSAGNFHAYRKVPEGEGSRIESHRLEAHCKSCAKLDLIKEHGGSVDLRGSAGPCAIKLKQYILEQKKKAGTDKPAEVAA